MAIKRTICIASCTFLLLPSIVVFAQDHIPTSAPAIKTFSQPNDISGAAANSVNLFTGDLTFPINLFSLPGHNGLAVAVTLGYSSNVHHIVDNWNLEFPTGSLGLGWSLDIPKVICDNKQTGTREDDEYYVMEAGASTRLIRTTSGSDGDGAYYAYEAKSYQFWKIKFYYDSVEMGSGGQGSNKWIIVKENGHKYVFGDKNSTRSTIQWVVKWNNWIGNSSQISGQSRLANIWNLSEIINSWGERITFEYENVEQFVGSSLGQKHTEASYLKKITDMWGRQVVFVYKDKQAPYYMEPHTEKVEPDGYQENYEKKYLDKIEVQSEGNEIILSVKFGYKTINAGSNAAKMLLSSIVQKNENGNSLPGMKFSYYTSGDSKGCLSTITYPTGATVNYTYTETVINHSDRQVTSIAPSGYAEPKLWMHEDYVVVAWRQLGTGGTHDDNPRDVKLYVYQWVGEWKEQFLQTIGSVSLSGDQYTKDYKDFQVTTEKDFFAVLSRGTGNYYSLFIRHKNSRHRGSWEAHSHYSVDYGDGVPRLVSGTNYVAVLGDRDDASHPSHLYTYQGDSWKTDVFDQTPGYHSYSGANNYFISQNRAVNFNIYNIPEFNFTFLTEDRKWTTRNWGSSIHFGSNDPSYWHTSNSMAIAMADNNPEFAYRWDVTYTNFYKDSKDKNNIDLFGQLGDANSVFMFNNGMVGIDGRLARFDGLNWTTTTITSTSASYWGPFFSYGDDYAVRPTSTIASGDYRGARKVFNPNTLNWEADVIMDGPDAGLNFANAGIDFYYFGNGFYYRQPNGSWIKKFTFPTNEYQTRYSKSGWPRYEVFHGSNPYPVVDIRYLKNGEMQTPLTLSSRNLLFIPYKFRNIGVGGETIASFPAYFSTGEDATELNLNRMINDAVTGLQKDYPVTLITINDGINTNYLTIDYNPNTATIDPQGYLAKYHEVTQIPGSNSYVNRPHGYTTTYFHNGLTATELGIPYIPVELLWEGMPYKKEVYDKDDMLKASEITTYQTHARTLQNNDNIKVMTAYYVRPQQVKVMKDNVETVTSHSYHSNTGLVTTSSITNFDSKNSTAYVQYKYFWEQYDVNRTLNFLTPVIQTKKRIIHGATTTYTEVSALTWKNWNGIYGPHKTYVWKRTGNPDFDFTSWSDTGEPTADWEKISEINSISANGNALQITEK